MSSKNVADTPTGTRPINDVEDFFSFLNANLSKFLTKICFFFFFSFTATNFLKVELPTVDGEEKQRQIKCLVKVSLNRKIKINVEKIVVVLRRSQEMLKFLFGNINTTKKFVQLSTCSFPLTLEKSSQMTHSIRASDTQVHFVTA